jgi:hypothetical protein
MEKKDLCELIRTVLKDLEEIETTPQTAYVGLCQYFHNVIQRMGLTYDKQKILYNAFLAAFNDRYGERYSFPVTIGDTDYYSFGVGVYTKYPSQWLVSASPTPLPESVNLCNRDEYFTKENLELWYGVRKQFLEAWLGELEK